jgi:biopolymer transport protein ExbB
MKAKRRLLIAGIVIGSLLTLSPFWGLLGTVVAMIRSFGTLSESGIADPQALSSSIGSALYSMATGFFLFPVGVILLTLSLVFFFRLRTLSPPPLPPARPH